ncbi:OLC1v1017270C1 [Oldenlandia corymbosa var. corymbosa]|uniref:OLC1v1017270C1 n=1 Tax=Oldenlandia corymbosa var. corymbosa TaxID=529605 RepID=A0AAV1E913_OLDCO|nr:OLC1v1017270C1 [Oldenlandia corymbosa var. corymbosa]
MEKDISSWFHVQQLERQLPNLNCLGAPLEVGQGNPLPSYMNPYLNELSINGTPPKFTFSGLPHLKACEPTQPCNWFNSLPHYPQAFTHGVNSLYKEKLSSEPIEKCGRTGLSNPGTQKKFLVFDQSGDQTTLIYSSGLGAPVQCLTSWNAKPPAANDPVKEDVGTKRFMFPHSAPFGTNGYNEDNQGDETESQMREDTEELNALLYSDDESESSEDDEVTSTGHSPSTMTEHGVQDGYGDSEEVASSASPIKKRKLLNGDFDVRSPTNVPSSEKPYKYSELEDDAESSCGNFDDQGSEESDSLSGKKRSRKEKIRETVSILRSIIPGGKGKDAMVVFDEAIHYLKSLKVKAKSLGLDAL